MIDNMQRPTQRNRGRRMMLVDTGVVPFLPTDIAGLQLWLDANDASTLFQDAAKTTPAGGGDVVGAWADKSGQGNDATQATTANKPTVSAAAINGINAILGDGTDDELDISVGPLTVETIFAVVTNNSSGSDRTVLGVNASFRLRFPATGTNEIEYRYNAVNASISAGFTEANANIFRAIYNGTQSNLSVNDGIPDTQITAQAGHTWGQVFSGPTRYFSGLMGELLIYDSALSVGNIALILDYLKNKWGTP